MMDRLDLFQCLVVMGKILVWDRDTSSSYTRISLLLSHGGGGGGVFMRMDWVMICEMIKIPMWRRISST